MKTKTVLILTLFLVSFYAQKVSASIIIYATEVANNVVFSGSGTINLNDLTQENGNWTSAAGIMNTGDGNVSFRMSPSGEPFPGDSYPLMHKYSGAVGPEEPFTTLSWFRQPEENSGIMLGMHVSELHISSEYVSGSLISPSMTYYNASFETLELIGGEYTWAWGNGENFDTLTVVVVPEPKSYAIALGLTAILLAFLKRRKPTIRQRLKPLRGHVVMFVIAHLLSARPINVTRANGLHKSNFPIEHHPTLQSPSARLPRASRHHAPQSRNNPCTGNTGAPGY